MKKFKKGEKVKYVGPDLVAYEKGKLYEVVGYNKTFNMYGVMSELDEAYMLPEEVLEKEKD